VIVPQNSSIIKPNSLNSQCHVMATNQLAKIISLKNNSNVACTQ